MISTPSLETWTTIGRLAGDHLWQSTLFAVLAALLTLTLRRNRAHVRYRLWLAVSAKFLVPFAALVSIGGQFGWRSAVSSVRPGLVFVMDASQPFSRQDLGLSAAALPTVSHGVAQALPLGLLSIWLTGFALILAVWWRRWLQIAAGVRAASPVERGRELDTLRRLETIGGIARPVALVSSSSSLEPGVFGIAKQAPSEGDRRCSCVWPSRQPCRGVSHVHRSGVLVPSDGVVGGCATDRRARACV